MNRTLLQCVICGSFVLIVGCAQMNTNAPKIQTVPSLLALAEMYVRCDDAKIEGPDLHVAWYCGSGNDYHYFAFLVRPNKRELVRVQRHQFALDPEVPLPEPWSGEHGVRETPIDLTATTKKYPLSLKPAGAYRLVKSPVYVRKAATGTIEQVECYVVDVQQ